MLPDNFPVVSGAELPNQFGGGYGRKDQDARKARDHISAGGALSGERAAREGTDFGPAVRRYGTASSARDPSTVGFGGAAATGPELRSFHSRCTNCAIASDRLCSKRLVAMIPFLLPGLDLLFNSSHTSSRLKASFLLWKK